MNLKPAAPRMEHGHRVTLFANYVHLFLATFTFGLLSPLAAILAYVRRRGADPISRTHYDFQIRSFWQDILLIIAGALAGYLAIASGLGALIGLTGVRLPFGVTLFQTGWAAVGFGLLWLALWVWGFVNLIIDSVRGLLRLVSGRPMGKTLAR